jgi:type I restriction enzyme R subunit
VPTCKNVAIVRNIGSMTEFKQIIGRGTRVRDDYGKLYFNILDYTGAATRQFADPDFDGDPALVTKVDINDNGEEIRTVREELSQSVTTLEADQEPPLTGPISLVDAPTTTPRKYYIDDHPVEIAGTVIWDLDAEGRRLRMVTMLAKRLERSGAIQFISLCSARYLP